MDAHTTLGRYFSIDELQRYRRLAAWLVCTYGSKYGAILDRVERDLQHALRDDPVLRAKRILNETQSQVFCSAPARLLDQSRGME
jgi:hypothetical protein